MNVHAAGANRNFVKKIIWEKEEEDPPPPTKKEEEDLTILNLEHLKNYDINIEK